MEEAILSTLSSLGFPAALCLYLLVRMQKTLDALTEAINNLNRDVEQREAETQNRLSRLEEIVRCIQQVHQRDGEWLENRH